MMFAIRLWNRIVLQREQNRFRYFFSELSIKLHGVNDRSYKNKYKSIKIILCVRTGSLYLCRYFYIYIYVPRGKKRRIKMLHGVLQGYKRRARVSEHQWSGGGEGVSPFEFRNWFDKNLCGPLPWLLSTYEMDSFSTKCTFIPPLDEPHHTAPSL